MGEEKEEKMIMEMGLDKSISHIFAARNIFTAKDALSLTEFDLMHLLGVGMPEVTAAIAIISEFASPPCQTALSLMERREQTEDYGGHFPTGLRGLDEALFGGIPFGVLTELVGPAGIGKTQLALLAALPTAYGGLNGRAIYIDVESKFSSRRMIEIGVKSFPEIFNKKGMAQEMAGRIVILRPTSLDKFTESLKQIKGSILRQQVKLIVIDSMAAVISGEYEQRAQRQNLLGWHISFIKSLAESSRIPIVVTNQVRSHSNDEHYQYSFQEKRTDDNTVHHDSHLVAALGINWAHSVTIRIVLEAKPGQRYIKLAKSSISPPLAFPFEITSAGISLLSDHGTELKGAEINMIHSLGHSDIINFGTDGFVDQG